MPLFALALAPLLCFVDPTGPAPESDPATESAASSTDQAKPASSGVDGPWRIGAFVDTAYPLNFNFPDNHLYRGTATTPRTNEFTLPAAGIWIDKAASEDSPWWFELGLHAGSAVNALSTSELVVPNAEAEWAGPAAFRHLARANGGVSLRSGTSFGAGLFSSPIGIGGFWSKDNWNYTPSWESNAAAFYLSGARISQALPAGFSIDGWIVNGWQTMADANDAPSGLLALNWSGDERWFLSQQVYFGPEGPSVDPEAWRVHSDTQLTYDTPAFGVGAVFDFGRDGPDPIAQSEAAMWTGAALFSRFRTFENHIATMDLAFRPEFWWDPQGRIFGVEQLLVAGTASMTWWFFERVAARFEYRYDHSTADGGFFFRQAATDPAGPGLARDQHTLFFALTATFEHRFAKREPQPPQ